MKKFAILFTSRNCYELFEPIFWEKSGNLDNFLILNVDCGSSVEQLSRRDKLIKKYGIIDLTIKDDPNIKSTERALELAAFYLSVHYSEIEWLFHAQNDGHFYKTENFALEFEKFLADNPEVNQAGMIGFTNWNYLDLNVPGYGRGNLVAGVFAAPYPGHYAKLPPAYFQKPYFIVESTIFTISAVNLSLFREYIKPDYNFIAYYWGDDISHQFMLHNIPIICAHGLHIMDDWRTKKKIGIPQSGNQSSFHMGDPKNHWKVWKEKWGWDWGFRFKDVIPQQFSSIKRKYTGTLTSKLRTWNLNDGPKTIKDLK